MRLFFFYGIIVEDEGSVNASQLLGLLGGELANRNCGHFVKLKMGFELAMPIAVIIINESARTLNFLFRHRRNGSVNKIFPAQIHIVQIRKLFKFWFYYWQIRIEIDIFWKWRMVAVAWMQNVTFETIIFKNWNILKLNLWRVQMHWELKKLKLIFKMFGVRWAWWMEQWFWIEKTLDLTNICFSI